MGKGVKIHGGPLQKAFAALLKAPQAPSQAKALKQLQGLLQGKGVDYHARTIKRQLQGDIEYIPQILEDAFFEWMERTPDCLRDRNYERLLPGIKSLGRLGRSTKNAIRKMPFGTGAGLLKTGKHLYRSFAR